LDRARVLNNVLAIDGGAGHARAVSMELWPKLTHQLFKLSARIISDKVCLLRMRPYANHTSSANLLHLRSLFRQRLDTNVEENLRQGGRL
jgi:hypothetical protein